MVEVTASIGGTSLATGTVSVVGPSTTGTTTLSVKVPQDEVFTTRSIDVTGTTTGYTTGSTEIAVVDDDPFMGTITVTASPPSATLNGGPQTITLKVKAVLSDKEVNEGAVIVTLTTKDNRGTLSLASVPLILRKNPDKVPATVGAEGTSGAKFTIIGDPQASNKNISVTLTLASEDVDNASEPIEVIATAPQYVTGTRTIPVRARGALDVAGFRAVISKPTGTAWANAGNDKIFVDVTRFSNVAYPWSQFESIKVAIHDTTSAHADHEIEAVTAQGFNLEDNGDVTFDEPGSGSRGDVIWRGNDTIRFEIRIRAYSPSRDLVESGQYLGAYARVVFSSGTTATIETRDNSKSVYPSNPDLVGNATVGDGRLIKIDNRAPANSGVNAVVVTSGDEVGRDIKATVDDEIRVAVAVSQINLFRDTGLRIQLQVVDGVGSVNGQTLTAAQRNSPSKNKDFNSTEVIAAAPDSLRHTFTVTEGFFTVTLDDFVEDVGEKTTQLDLNNARARVRAGIRDQAGNYTFSGWTTFDVDSRSPGVSILYPSAAPDSIYDHTYSLRFTGADISTAEGQNVDDDLNPLALVVDEELVSLMVFAVGSDTLDISNQLSSGGVAGDSLSYSTIGLNSPVKDDDDEYPDERDDNGFVPSSANIAGTEITLAVLAEDELGNVTITKISGVVHDDASPTITEWFPKNSLIEDDQINDATRHPAFTLKEDVDSVAVSFSSASADDVTEEVAGLTEAGEIQVMFSDALVQDASYTMTIFARDLAGECFHHACGFLCKYEV